MLDDQFVEQGGADGIDVVESRKVGHIILIGRKVDNAVDAVEGVEPVFAVAHVPLNFFNRVGQVDRPAVWVNPFLQGGEDANFVALGH